jgi:hypothetical protein
MYVLSYQIEEMSMPAAQPLPKKHLAAIRDAQSELKCLAQRLTGLLEGLESSPRPMTETLKGTLQELQSGCYVVALRLSELEFADGCDHCPCAPPRTVAEIHLALLSRKLRRLSDETWQSSQANPYNDERIN